MKKIFLRTFHRITWLVLLLLDVCLNRLFGGKVETISSRAGRAKAAGKEWGCVLCRALDAIQPNHCENAMKKPLSMLE